MAMVLLDQPACKWIDVRASAHLSGCAQSEDETERRPVRHRLVWDFLDHRAGGHAASRPELRRCDFPVEESDGHLFDYLWRSDVDPFLPEREVPREVSVDAAWSVQAAIERGVLACDIRARMGESHIHKQDILMWFADREKGFHRG